MRVEVDPSAMGATERRISALAHELGVAAGRVRPAEPEAKPKHLQLAV